MRSNFIGFEYQRHLSFLLLKVGDCQDSCGSNYVNFQFTVEHFKKWDVWGFMLLSIYYYGTIHLNITVIMEINMVEHFLFVWFVLI
jgi:hypothetical protein